MHPTAGSPGPLSSDDLRAISDAKHAARSVRRTVGVARASGWTTGVLGGLTLLGVLFGDLTSLVLGSALLALGVREARLGGTLARFDGHAPRRLASNQIALGVVIVLYAAWSGIGAYRSNGLSAANQPVGDPQVDAMLADIGNLTRHALIAFYVCVGVGGATATALMAMYYARATRRLAAFVERTPAWVVQTMRAAA